MAALLLPRNEQQLYIAVGAALVLGTAIFVCFTFKVIRCCLRPNPLQPLDEDGAVPEDHLLPKSPRLTLTLPGAVPAGASPKLNGAAELSFDEADVKCTLRGTAYTLDRGVAHLSPHKARYLVADGAGQPWGLVVTRVDTRRTAYPIHQEDSQAAFTTLLTSLHHPHLEPVVSATFSLRSQATYVVRSVANTETLRDVVQQRALQAAAAPRPAAPSSSVLPDGCIGRYGRDILEGLKALRHIGFPYPQLTAGTILVVNDACRLTDLEDIFTGHHPPSGYQGLRLGIEEFRFGQVLMEMATGRVPEEVALLRNALRADADLDLSDREIASLLHGAGPGRRCSQSLEALLQMLYAPEAEVTVEDLLADDFFHKAAGGRAPSSPKLSSIHRDILHGISQAMLAIDLQDSPITTSTASWCRFEALV